MLATEERVLLSLSCGGGLTVNPDEELRVTVDSVGETICV